MYFFSLREVMHIQDYVHFAGVLPPTGANDPIPKYIVPSTPCRGACCLPWCCWVTNRLDRDARRVLCSRYFSWVPNGLPRHAVPVRRSLSSSAASIWTQSAEGWKPTQALLLHLPATVQDLESLFLRRRYRQPLQFLRLPEDLRPVSSLLPVHRHRPDRLKGVKERGAMTVAAPQCQHSRPQRKFQR